MSVPQLKESIFKAQSSMLRVARFERESAVSIHPLRPSFDGFHTNVSVGGRLQLTRDIHVPTPWLLFFFPGLSQTGPMSEAARTNLLLTRIILRKGRGILRTIFQNVQGIYCMIKWLFSRRKRKGGGPRFHQSFSKKFKRGILFIPRFQTKSRYPDSVPLPLFATPIKPVS